VLPRSPYIILYVAFIRGRAKVVVNSRRNCGNCRSHYCIWTEHTQTLTTHLSLITLLAEQSVHQKLSTRCEGVLFGLCPTSKKTTFRKPEAQPASETLFFKLRRWTKSRRQETVSVSHTPASEPYSAALNYVLHTFTATQAVRGVIRRYKCGTVQIFGAVTKIKII